MWRRRTPPVHIAIEGAVGVGKSTLLAALEVRFASEAIVFVPEPVDVWREKGTLARYYDEKMSALEFQLVALTTLYSKLAQSLVDPRVRVVVTERSLRSNLEVFAELNLQGSAIIDYRIAFDALAAALPPCPEVIFYLRAEPTCLQQRVQARGRAEEATLDESFHVTLTEAHDRMCARHPRVVVIDAQRNATEVAQAGVDAMSGILGETATRQGQKRRWRAWVQRMCRWASTIVVGNRAVAAASRHATSVHLGLAADSVAQADYDMASRGSAW